MSKGFLTVCENNNETDFVQMAYLLALSLKKSQKKYNKLSIMVSDIDTISDRQMSVFDKVIMIPKDYGWYERTESLDTTSLCDQYYNVTPYDETIVLDADMVFTEDILSWWDVLKNEDLVFSEVVKTFKGTNINGDFYRKTFTDNELPNIYTGMFYFKKSEKAKEFFELVNKIFDDWRNYFFELDENTRPTFLSADVAYAMAYKYLNYASKKYLGVPVFTHMKSRLQDLNLTDEIWTNHLSVNIDSNLELNIENYSQILPFHYHDKNFLSKEIIELYEDAYYNVNKL